MLDAIARALNESTAIGQVAIRKLDQGGFAIFHNDDEGRSDLEVFRTAEAALSLGRFDDSGKYRPLKTAPNLRHGWRMELGDLAELTRALEYFYPGRLAVLAAWNENRLKTTPLRKTLDRQSGMYRVAATITDDQVDDVVGNFCRTDGGCLRTILWRRDELGATPSTKLPPEKFQATETVGIPLLCQEACNLLVNECRKVVKGEPDADL